MSHRYPVEWFKRFLGVELRPWQAEVMQRIMAGEPIIFWSRRSGRIPAVHKEEKPMIRQFARGDFVEYDSTAKEGVLRGVVTHVGFIGKEPKQPRLVAFVQGAQVKSPLLVAHDRLRPGKDYALWADRTGSAA